MKIYEACPNKEVVSNASHSCYFPPMVSLCKNTFNITYMSDTNDNPIDKEYKRYFRYNYDYDVEYIRSIHDYLDVTCIAEEDVINFALLFSITSERKIDNVTLHLIRRQGIESSILNNSEESNNTIEE